MKRYRLKKDLPTFKAGDKFYLCCEGLVWDNPEGKDIVAYALRTLEKFPNILTEWFEEIPEEPKTVWDLKTNDIFFVIEDGRIAGGKWNWSDYTRNRDAGDVFLTKNEAEKELAWRKARTILQRDTKGFKPNYRECNFGWGVSYEVMDREPHFETDWAEWVDGTIRFATEADAKASIKAHEKEWRIYLNPER